RRREHALYRVILKKRPRAKQWAQVLRPSEVMAIGDPMARDPSDVTSASCAQATDAPAGASAAAVRYHYDVSNDFYRLWLGPLMMYSSGLWSCEAGDAVGL